MLILDAVRPRFGPAVTLNVQGPERIALVGTERRRQNHPAAHHHGELPPPAGEIRLRVPARLLPQRLDVLDGALTVAGNAARFAPHATPNAIRANLARMLFPGRRADQPVSTLSGGELFRATLAALLLAEPAPQLLMLDEPTNNLDLASVGRLTEALRCYPRRAAGSQPRRPVPAELGLTRWLRLDAALAEIDPL